VTRLSVLSIVILAVRRQQSLHDAAEKALTPFDEKMKMIGHQAISIKIERELSLLACELEKEFAVVIVVQKDWLPIVASRHYVIEPALNF
jgi:hypothetical protein